MVKTEKEEIKILKKDHKVLNKRVTAIEKFIEKNGLSKNGRLVHCDHVNKKTNKPCGYSWITRTKMNSISCPSCGNKIKVE